MSDESVNYEGNNPPPGTISGAGPAGFCQDCGTPLTQQSVRTVGTGVFCEPCLAARVGPAAGVPPVAGTAYADTLSGTPHPVLAAVLGIIPGVGAMYNGQYAKGVAHLLIFLVLDSLSKHVNGIFGLLTAFWFFYQIVDAYQTAKARLEGRPVPNPFGLNDIGERMGFGKGSGTSATGAGAAPPYQSAPFTSAPFATGPASPGGAGPEWVGYVPPTQFGGAPPVVPPAAQAGAAWGQAPYAPSYNPTYSGVVVEPAPVSSVHAVPNVPVAVPTRRFPVGAIWLIGLGVVFLVAEFAPDWGWDWSLGEHWVLPVLFAGLAVWTFVRRMTLGLHSLRELRAPILLTTLAVVFALHAADVVSLGRIWPVFLIVLGGMLFAERTALGNLNMGKASFGGAGYAPTSFVPAAPTEAEAAAERTRAAWSAPVAQPEAHTAVDSHEAGPNDMKGGQ